MTYFRLAIRFLGLFMMILGLLMLIKGNYTGGLIDLFLGIFFDMQADLMYLKEKIALVIKDDSKN